MTWDTRIINNSNGDIVANNTTVPEGQEIVLNEAHAVTINAGDSGILHIGEPQSDDFTATGVTTTWAVKISSGEYTRYWGYEGHPTLLCTINNDSTFNLPSSCNINFDHVPIGTDPPTYDSIMAEMVTALGPNPTPEAILRATRELPSYKAAIISDAVESGNGPVLTDEEKAKLAIGMAKTISAADTQAKLAESANMATLACQAVSGMFLNLAVMLASIDSKGTPPPEGAFAPRLRVISDKYRSTLSDSRDLAIAIATYGERFDTLIVPICCDSNVPVDQRKTAIQGFISEAATFSTSSSAMNNKFDSLVTDFGVFQATFTNWSIVKEGELTAELIEANKKLGELQVELTNLNSAMLFMGAAAAASLPATGIIAWLSGPAAPFVILGGLIFAAASTAAFIALSVAVSNKKIEVEEQQKVVDRLNAEIAEIQQARQALVKLGGTSLDIFKTNLGLLSNYWLNAHNDAVEIQIWLNQGADVANMPTYMCQALQNAVTIYKSMSKYLHDYANGVIIPPTPAS